MILYALQKNRAYEVEEDYYFSNLPLSIDCLMTVLQPKLTTALSFFELSPPKKSICFHLYPNLSTSEVISKSAKSRLFVA